MPADSASAVPVLESARPNRTDRKRKKTGPCERPGLLLLHASQIHRVKDLARHRTLAAEAHPAKDQRCALEAGRCGLPIRDALLNYATFLNCRSSFLDVNATLLDVNATLLDGAVTHGSTAAAATDVAATTASGSLTATGAATTCVAAATTAAATGITIASITAVASATAATALATVTGHGLVFHRPTRQVQRSRRKSRYQESMHDDSWCKSSHEFLLPKEKRVAVRSLVSSR